MCRCTDVGRWFNSRKIITSLHTVSRNVWSIKLGGPGCPFRPGCVHSEYYPSVCSAWVASCWWWLVVELVSDATTCVPGACGENLVSSKLGLGTWLDGLSNQSLTGWYRDDCAISSEDSNLARSTDNNIEAQQFPDFHCIQLHSGIFYNDIDYNHLI